MFFDTLLCFETMVIQLSSSQSLISPKIISISSSKEGMGLKILGLPLHLLNPSLMDDPGDCHGWLENWCCAFHGSVFVNVLPVKSLCRATVTLSVTALTGPEKAADTEGGNCKPSGASLNLHTFKEGENSVVGVGDLSKPNTLKRENNCYFEGQHSKLKQ